MRGVRVLAVDRLHRRPVRAQRQAHAHVQLQRRHARLLRGVGGAHGGAGDDHVGRAPGIAEHGLARADGHVCRLDPRGVALAGHEQPLAIAAAVQHRDRVAGEQRRLLEAVDVGLAGAAEHAQRGREGTQRGAMDHQAVLQGLAGGDGVQRDRLLQRIQRLLRHRLALHVEQGAGRRRRKRHHLLAHHRARQWIGQGGDVVDRAVLGAHARVLRGDAGTVQDHPVRFGELGDPVLRGQVGLANVDHRGRCVGLERGRRRRGQQQRQQGGDRGAVAEAVRGGVG